ncbi:GDSL-type esterase/lipase family protein [Thermophagus sp. OGC60D27]|uniref:GDSL-type esterase/lipase family protein n=1 Tax=Thermophagus sp. OGC60D27 TaxID=3458415 RepID=UPI004037B96E
MENVLKNIIQLRRLFLLAFFCFNYLSIWGQEVNIDTSFANNYYLNKRAMHETVSVKSWNVIFLGNSITERGFWKEWFPSIPILNRGIGGDNCWGVYDRLDSILAGKPAMIIMMIGINDLGRGIPVPLIADQYEQIIKRIKEASPCTKLILQTVLPINEETIWYDYMKGKTSKINELNTCVRGLGQKHNLLVIDLHKLFSDANDQLPKNLCVDGLHLNEKGYQVWVDYFKTNNIFN